MPYTVAKRYPAVLQLKHSDCNPVDIENYIRPFIVLTTNRDLLGDSEVIKLRMLPVDQLNGFSILPYCSFYWNPVMKQAVDFPIVIVKASVRVVGLNAKFMNSLGNLYGSVTLSQKIGTQQAIIDIAVAQPISPVAEIAIAKLVPEQGDNPILRFAFRVADDGHCKTSQ